MAPGAGSGSLSGGDGPPRPRGAVAIDGLLERVQGRPPDERYHPRAPRLRGGRPLDEIAATLLEGPLEHWHLVTYGLSDLDEGARRGGVSGWGFELTMRLVWSEGPPTWAVDLLANLAAYVWSSGHPFAPGHHLDLTGPIKLDADSALSAAVIVRDRSLGVLDGPGGSVTFLQVVGLTADELERCRAWSTHGVVGILARDNPMLVTDIARGSVLEAPAVAAEVGRRAAGDGSALTELRVASLRWNRRRRGAVVELGAGTAAALGPALRRELIGAGASFRVVGDRGELRFAVAGDPGWRPVGEDLEVDVPLAEVEVIADLFDGRTGWGRRPGWPGLAWHVVP